MSDNLLLPDQCIKVTFASVLTVISPAGRRKMLLRFLPCQIQGLDPFAMDSDFSTGNDVVLVGDSGSL